VKDRQAAVCIRRRHVQPVHENSTAGDMTAGEKKCQPARKLEKC